jgi:hypothetical protein
VLSTGVALIYLGFPQFEPLAGLGSIGLIAAMLAFVVLVYRPEGAKSITAPMQAPAE